jgi:hypothetical protein
MISIHLIRFAPIAYCGCVLAQAPLDPATIDLAAKLKPGQSIVRGDGKLTLQQRAAGTKDDKGWFTASSKEGGFSVRFPAPANEETYSFKAPDGTRIEQNILTSQTSTTRYMVMCTKLNQSSEAAKQTLEQVIGSIEDSSQKFNVESFVLGRLNGTRYSGVDAQGVYVAGQLFLFGKQLCRFQAGSHVPFEGIPTEIHDWLVSFRPMEGGKD